MFEVTFFSGHSERSLLQADYLLLFMIRGEASLSLLTRTCRLQHDDVYLLNSSRPATMSLSDNAFVLSCSIDVRQLRDLYHSNQLYFRCDSTSYTSVKYEQLRYLIHNLLGEYSLDSAMTAKKLSILYRITDLLLSAFASSGDHSSSIPDAGKLDPVFQYIHTQYMNKITLPEAAKQIFMAPQSLSRLFARTTGTTFTRYLNDYRLQRAADLLLTTSMQVLDIALDCGFTSPSQFNKNFRQKYGIAPTDYRASGIEASAVPHSSPDTIANPSRLIKELEAYQSKTRMTIVREQRIRMQSIEADVTHAVLSSNPWNSTLYLGFTSLLLSGAYQNQLIDLKRSLSFHYGTINGLFSPELRLMEHKGASRLNFVNLDHALDFLVEKGIRPLIVFDNQILKMLKNLDEITEIPVVDLFDNIDDLCRVVGMIIDHVVNRYGLAEVSEWRFNLWYFVYRKSLLGIKGYFPSLWDRFYETIRDRIPEASIGGCNYSISVHREECLAFYRDWALATHQPDFVTCTMFPYQEAEEPTKMNAIRQNIEHFSLRQLEQFRELLNDAGFPPCPILVQEWNISFVQRNFLNDMAAKAAIMAKQMTDLFGEVETVCYWNTSDILAGDYDADRILNGACGLISTDGILKPAYYALKFFSLLPDQLISRGEHYIITRDRGSRYVIILFNNKELNYNYYSKDESSIGINDDETIFSEHDTLEITLSLTGMEDREYCVRKQLFGPSYGSVLDEWKLLGVDSQLTLSDLSYLKQKSVPLRKNEQLLASRGTLQLMESLDPHEMMLIEIL